MTRSFNIFKIFSSSTPTVEDRPIGDRPILDTVDEDEVIAQSEKTQVNSNTLPQPQKATISSCPLNTSCISSPNAIHSFAYGPIVIRGSAIDEGKGFTKYTFFYYPDGHPEQEIYIDEKFTPVRDDILLTLPDQDIFKSHPKGNLKLRVVWADLNYSPKNQQPFISIDV